MAIIKIRELLGTSTKSFEDALQQVVDFVGKDKHNLTGLKIIDQSVGLDKGQIVEYKVNVKAAYKWDNDK